MASKILRGLESVPRKGVPEGSLTVFLPFPGPRLPVPVDIEASNGRDANGNLRPKKGSPMKTFDFAARHPMRALGALTALIAAVAVAVGSSASFTASSANPSNTFAAGTLSILNSKEGLVGPHSEQHEARRLRALARSTSRTRARSPAPSCSRARTSSTPTDQSRCRPSSTSSSRTAAATSRAARRPAM